MNKLVELKTTETAIAIPNEGDPYERYANEGAFFSGDLLRFTKRGNWVRGRDGEPVPTDIELVTHMRDLCRGWVLWFGQKPTYDSRLIGSLADNFEPPARMSLGHLDAAEWERDPASGVA